MAEHDVRGDLLGVLRGPEAEALLRQSLETSGMAMRGWELEQIHARSGAEISARYRVRCAVPDADLRARPPGQPDPTDPVDIDRPSESAELTMVASTVALTPRQRSHMGAVRADSSQGTVHLWVHPVDPELPGLLVVERRAADGEDHRPTALESRLSRVLGEQCRLQSLQMLVLRPLRRAVYRAVVVSARGRRTLYLKVVRPTRAQQLLARHGCSELIPAVADAGDGILVLDEAPGLALTSLLYRPTAPADVVLPDPQVLITALETLRPETLELPPRRSPAGRLDALEDSAIAAGADSCRVKRLRTRIEAGLCERPGPLVPTHGDFHPANLFLDETGRHPTGLIDADTAGPGHRVDDLATMLGHLLTLPSFDAQGYAAVPEFARRFYSRCLLHADRVDLGARTAAVLLSLLPGAHSADQREHHLHRAETVLGRFSPEDPPR